MTEQNTHSTSQIWREQLEHVEHLLLTVRDRTTCAEDGTDLLKDELRRAQIASVFPEQHAEVYDALTRAAGAAQAAMITQQRWRCYEDDGQVELQEPGHSPRRIPVGDARLHWPTWLQGLAAALIVRDIDTVNTLCIPESIEACSLPTSRIDPFWPFYCSAFAAAVVEPTAASALIADTTTGLNQAQIADPAVIQLRFRPILELVSALITNDADTFNAALNKTLTAHRQLCEQQDPYEWSDLFALEATALAALAHDRKLPITVDSDYLPIALITGEFPRDYSQVIYHFPQRSILTASEAHWFLDLAGFPAKNRIHQLLDNNGQLIARYKAHQAPGLPRAIASFSLIETTHLPNPPHSLALDAGQLLFIAEAYASNVPDNKEQANARIQTSIACIDAVLTRIPTDQTAVPADTIISPQGKEIYQTEPGRFRRDRLIAYRSGLETFSQTLTLKSNSTFTDSSTHNKTPSPDKIFATAKQPKPAITVPESQSQEEALAAIEIIRVQVMPLLQTLGQKNAGEIIQQLIPQPEDYKKVFVGEAIKAARHAYEKLWTKTPKFQSPAPNQTEIRCYVSPAGMFQSDNELSFHFPQGYRAIAPYLNPHRIWVAWQYHAPNQSAGVAFDGLVWLDDHWVWFPKPYRMLRNLTN